MVIEPEMLVLPGAEFLMGSDAGREDESPIHRVRVRPFALARYPITNSEYQGFLEETGRAAPPAWSNADFQHSEQPVTSVNWFDASDYCKWLSTKTGRQFRLPTEAEWEVAARGGLEQALYTWGNDEPESQPGYHELWIGRPEQVGRRPPNRFGLNDIGENIHEWCADWYDPLYYCHSPYANPEGPETGTRKASRGGSWRHKIKIARVSARSSIPPDYKYNDYGFRIAMTF